MSTYQIGGLYLLAVAVLIVLPTLVVSAVAVVMDHMADRRGRR